MSKGSKIQISSRLATARTTEKKPEIHSIFLFFLFSLPLFICTQVGIPVAAGVLLPLTGTILTPSIAGALMGLSSVGVMANSLLLRIRLASKRTPPPRHQVRPRMEFESPAGAEELAQPRTPRWKSTWPTSSSRNGSRRWSIVPVCDSKLPLPLPLPNPSRMTNLYGHWLARRRGGCSHSRFLVASDRRDGAQSEPDHLTV